MLEIRYGAKDGGPRPYDQIFRDGIRKRNIFGVAVTGSAVLTHLISAGKFVSVGNNLMRFGM
jgi:hypothetical protein